jgi:excisionase family DNA binding protein
MERERVYSVEQAAQKLGLDKKTVYDAIHDGDLPSIKVGRRILVPAAAFDRLLDEGIAQRTAQ